MNQNTIVIVVVVAVVVLALVGALLAWRRKRRSGHLREQFGPEYDEAVNRSGSRRAGEHDLAGREERHEKHEIRELDPADRQRYAEAWYEIQMRFVDQPLDAVRDAHRLVRDVMTERGYPTDDEEAAEGVSVDHPEVMGDYRAADRIVRASQQGEVTTEQLRDAMLRYRSLADHLLGTGTGTGNGDGDGTRDRDGDGTDTGTGAGTGTDTGPGTERT